MNDGLPVNQMAAWGDQTVIASFGISHAGCDFSTSTLVTSLYRFLSIIQEYIKSKNEAKWTYLMSSYRDDSDTVICAGRKM